MLNKRLHATYDLFSCRPVVCQAFTPSNRRLEGCARNTLKNGFFYESLYIHSLALTRGSCDLHVKRPATASVYTDFLKKTFHHRRKQSFYNRNTTQTPALVSGGRWRICDLRLATADASESRTYFLKTDVEPTSTLSRVASHHLYRIDTNPTSRHIEGSRPHTHDL